MVKTICMRQSRCLDFSVLQYYDTYKIPFFPAMTCSYKVIMAQHLYYAVLACYILFLLWCLCSLMAPVFVFSSLLVIWTRWQLCKGN